MQSETHPIEALGNEIANRAQRISLAMHELLTDIRHFDEADGWKLEGESSCASWLGRNLELGSSTAHERLRIARALGKLPRIDAAFANGELSYSKVRAITRVATSANEKMLLSVARTSSGAELEKFCRNFRKERRAPAPTRFVRRKTVPACAMVRIELQLTPSEAEQVWRSLVDAAGIGDRSSADPSAVTHVVNLLAGLAPAAAQPETLVVDTSTGECHPQNDTEHAACVSAPEPCRELVPNRTEKNREEGRRLTLPDDAPQSARG